MPPKSATKKISNAAKSAAKNVPKPGAAAKRGAKQAPRPVKKAASAVKSAGSRATKGGSRSSRGWTGGEGGASTDLNKWYGPNRNLYLPDGLLDRSQLPNHLDGTLPGDYGYDPLNLGANGNVEKYRTAELIHARWAMLAAAGIIIPEGLALNGAELKGATWFETGAAMLNGGTLNYFAVPWAVINNPLPLAAVTVIEVALLGAAENYRRKGEGPPGYSPGFGKFEEGDLRNRDNLYPGGPFDPLGLASDPEVFQELKVKEIKNGRLAMVSVLAFALQGYVTGEGPYANWAKHVSDPFGYNLLTILVGDERVPTL